MKKLMLGLMLACAATVVKAEMVTYLDCDAEIGMFNNATVECTAVTSETTTFADGGWYVAKGANTCNKITVSGAAHLILADGAELTVSKGIRVAKGNSLTIYGQDEGNGKLMTYGGSSSPYTCSGIGGGVAGESCGAITVNGGVVVAEGGGVGIGGATGAMGNPLFGGGGPGGDGGSLTVNGGFVTASKIGGGEGGPASGGNGPAGRGTAVIFRGGVTEARNGIFTDGDPILGSSMKVTGNFNKGSYIKVEDQSGPSTKDVTFVLGDGVIGITTDFTGESQSEGNRVTLKDVEVGTRIGIIEVTCALGFEYHGVTEFVVSATEMPHGLNATQIETRESVEYAVPGESALSVVRNVSSVFPGPNTFTNGGWYVATARQSCGVIEVNGSANLILADGAELTVDGGIRVTEGNSLTIYGQNAGTGRLIANGAEGCAGIGGGGPGAKGTDGHAPYTSGKIGGSGGSCGTVTINGGVVTATAGRGAAGIGGGMGGTGGNGWAGSTTGTLESEFYYVNGGAGGAGGNGGVLIINAGQVTATGGTGAPDIGGGNGGTGGAGGAELGYEYVIGDGGAGGVGGAGGSVTVNGGMLTATRIGGGAGGIGGVKGEYGSDGAVGDGGAGVTATFRGGVTEAQNGIFTEGELNLGENMVVTGEFNKAAYIKIAEKPGPTCTGGDIEEIEDGVWVVKPTGNATEVTITGLAEGETVAGVKIGDYVVPSAAFVGFGAGATEGVFSLALDPEGEVNGVKVKPIIGELDDGEGGVATQPFVVGEGGVAVTVKAIPGLKYELLRTGALAAPAAENGGGTVWGVVGEPVVAKDATVTLKDGNPPEGAAFYRVVVSVP